MGTPCINSVLVRDFGVSLNLHKHFAPNTNPNLTLRTGDPLDQWPVPYISNGCLLLASFFLERAEIAVLQWFAKCKYCHAMLLCAACVRCVVFFVVRWRSVKQWPTKSRRRWNLLECTLNILMRRLPLLGENNLSCKLLLTVYDRV